MEKDIAIQSLDNFYIKKRPTFTNKLARIKRRESRERGRRKGTEGVKERKRER